MTHAGGAATSAFVSLLVREKGLSCKPMVKRNTSSRRCRGNILLLVNYNVYILTPMLFVGLGTKWSGISGMPCILASIRPFLQSLYQCMISLGLMYIAYMNYFCEFI